MSVHNADIAAVFEEIADLLEIRNENPFRGDYSPLPTPFIATGQRSARTTGTGGELLDSG